jgi:orotate phosphoribosyltransferase
MNLFQKVNIILNSGQPSDFKIECDALTKEDLDCFAYLISKKIKFSKVIGVPTGGIRIQEALEQYVTLDPTLPLLIVDDVLTTGGSMNRYKNKFEEMGYDNIKGIVIFSRTTPPNWIESVFTMW